MKTFFIIFLLHMHLFVQLFKEADTGVLLNRSIRSDQGLPDECYQPTEIGRCFALFHRYAYNIEKGECVPFIYGGCGGNSNNFKTKIECEDKCLNKRDEKII